MILIACALRAELKHMRARAGIEILETGVGPVEAAIAVASALARAPFTTAINAGIGGTFRDSGHRVGDAVLVVDEALADLGLEGGGSIVLPGGATLAERESADEALAGRLTGLPHAHGVTVASVTTTDRTAERLRGRYHADIESMEGFAVLRAAALARVPALEVRGISNYVGDRATSEWDFDAGARATALALESILDQMS